MRMRRLKIAIPCGLALGLGLSLAACQTTSQQVEQPPNARSLIMVHKAILWRDLESIKNASIATPQRHAGGWRVSFQVEPLGGLLTFSDFPVNLLTRFGAVPRPHLEN